MSPSKKAAATPSPDRFVIFLRHGIAEEATPEKKDEDRGLTAEGHAKMKQIARGLGAALPKAQAIYSSPLLRAVQTALWVSKGYRSRARVNPTEALAPSAPKKHFATFIRSVSERRVIVVGHEPSLTENVSALVGVSLPQLKKGGCYGVRLTSEGEAILEWMLPPRILRKLGE